MSRPSARINRRSARWAIAASAAAFLAFGGVAVAQAEDIISSTGANTFAGGPFSQTAGDIPNYVNPAGSTAPHNVVATTRGPDGEPLFSSATIGPGASSPVAGAQYLVPGTYHFVCTLHEGMADDLTVTGGTPAPRPEIAVAIPAQKLKKVRKSGKLAVAVDGVNDANDVDLVVTKGPKVLGESDGISIPDGTTLTVPVKLTGAGKKAIAGGKKAKVAAKGSLAFGKTATAKRTLR